MKLALLFFGIHYLERYIHWTHWSVSIDFKQYFDNYKEHLFDYLEKQYKEIDTYISSYHSEKEKLLLSIYHPTRYKFSNIRNGVDHTIQRNQRFLELIDLPQKEYDFYLITRFDLDFVGNFDMLKIDDNKINIPHKTGNFKDKDIIEDNFYIISAKCFDKFKNICKSIPLYESFHKLHYYNKELEINYMIDGFFYSFESPFYRFRRNFVR